MRFPDAVSSFYINSVTQTSITQIDTGNLRVCMKQYRSNAILHLSSSSPFRL